MSTSISNYKKWNSIKNNYPFQQAPVPDRVGSLISEIELERADVNYLNVNYFNGDPVVGGLVTTDAIQTLTNKSLVDDSTYIISSIEPTGMIMFTAPTTPNTTTMITSLASSDQNIVIPDIPNADFVLTEGDQQINGTKTFSGYGIHDPNVGFGVKALPVSSFTGSAVIATLDFTTQTQIRAKLNLLISDPVAQISGSNVVDFYFQIQPTFIYGFQNSYIGDNALDSSVGFTASLSGNSVNIEYTSTYPDEIVVKGIAQTTLS